MHFFRPGWIALTALPIALSGCVFELGSNSGSLSGPACWSLDFDVDGVGAPILPGQIVEDAYLARGVSIDVFRGHHDGLGVAFDSANPTGGDTDLGFPGLGNLLINQEHFTQADIEAGRVEVPDDHSCGARFELGFETPVCLTALTLLDIDEGEDPVVIELFDAAGEVILHHEVVPGGDHQRVDVVLPPQAECLAVKAVIELSGSGAVDNIQICDQEVEPVVWTRTYDNRGSEVANGVAVDGFGRVAIGGYDDQILDVNGLVQVYGPDGSLLWTQEIDGGDADSIEAVAADAEGQVVVAGAIGDGGLEDVVVQKLTPTGNTIWTRTFDSGGVDTGLGVAIGADGAIAVTGMIAGVGGSDIWVRLYDSDGNELWTRTADEGSDDAGLGVAIDADGRVIVAGQVGAAGSLQAWLRVYDRTGAEVWTRQLPLGSSAAAQGVAVDAGGGIAIAGYRIDGDANAFVAAFTADGANRWGATFDSGADDAARGVAVDSTGAVIVNGFQGTHGVDIWTRKYSAGGDEIWTQTFDGGGADVGTGAAVAPDDRIAVCGFIDGGSDLDAWVRLYQP
jgi:hypothetical protein